MQSAAAGSAGTFSLGTEDRIFHSAASPLLEYNRAKYCTEMFGYSDPLSEDVI